MITQSLPTEGPLRDVAEAAYRIARASVYDIRPHDHQGPLERSQQRALDDLQEAELELLRFRRQPLSEGVT
jgi:hypothetical protein